MYVGDTGNIFIEKHHAVYPHVIDFLISCCEPVSRTRHMEQYRLDSSSLSAASAEGTYSLDMIRNILRYFRQESMTGSSAIDLEKLRALEAWASSREAELDSTSYTHCLLGAQAPSSPLAAGSSSPPKDVEGGAGTAKREDVCDVPADGAPHGPRRVLTLRPTPAAAAAAAAGPSHASASPLMVGPTQPLVALAVREPGWTPPPLPLSIETVLAEEEGSAKMRIVLQPRLRRFTTEDTPNATFTGAGRPLANRDAGGGERLYYFVVSHDRAHLEKVIASDAKAFLEPTTLHGTPRWIISDVDKGVEEMQAAAESGRPATLRRLYATGVCAGGGQPRRGPARSSTPASSPPRLVYKTQVKPGKLRELKERLFHTFGIRADCFYDHLQDPSLHVENLRLARSVRLRPYQTASLERFQRGSKAHQGVVVLPCGAGKTLTGIGAAALMRKTTVVMCINNMSVFQWQREFLRWTALTEDEVTVCTAKEKAMPGRVFITTYSMLVAKRGDATGAAARESEEILKAVRGRTWGLLLLDEVHTALAHHFQEVLNQLTYKCVLGLSATLLREDDRIGDLRHLVGPKLFEANWLDLTRAGFLATVECAEVQCPMPAAFFAKYCAALAGETTKAAAQRQRKRLEAEAEEEEEEDDDDDGSNISNEDGDGDGARGGRKRLRRQRRGRRAPGGINSLAHNMAASNPYKLWCTQALLAFHQNRSPPDKVIIFCDYLADVRFYAYHLHLPFMDQRTSESERTNLLRYFQFSDTVNAIVLTRVGDVALDLPCASVIIQISGLGASRRQEAQRLGRILRPKPPSLDNTCSYFYTLVSRDTHEVRTGYARQSWLRDQGFAYRVLRCEQVLAAFARVGGVPRCVGPPQWWYHVPATAAVVVAAKAGAAAGRASAVVEHRGAWWAPFSPEASARMHYYFNRGKPGCVLLGGEHLGSATPRPPPQELGGVAVRPDESWSVQFSSADAPATFGTVLIGEAPLVGDGGGGGTSTDSCPAPSFVAAPGHDGGRVRRITFGQFNTPHNCLDEDGPCLDFALGSLDATVDDDAGHAHDE